MLEPDSRAVLLQQLAPPPGFRMEGAIAATFTLDLTATLVPALAFSSYSFAGASADPVAVLESIRQTSDRLDVFCQGGNIAVPNRAPDLLAFLEPMVHEVRRPTGGLFHPKVWFVKYVDEAGVAVYRLLVLTRNLTLDASWDLAVRLDSIQVASRALPSNAPLGDLLASLPRRSIRPLPQARASRIAQLAAESRRVEWEKPDTVEEVLFHLLDQGRSGSPSFEGRRHLVVSPFLNDAGLDLFPAASPITILSRAAEMEKLSPNVVERLNAFVMDSMAVVTEGEGTNLLGQLHAKMYVIEPHGRAHQARVMIGSANATDAAWQRNVEFMVEFRGPRKHLGVEAFLGVDAPFRALVAPYEPAGGAPIDAAEDEQRRLENALRAVAEIAHAVKVLPPAAAATETTLYRLDVSAGNAYPLPDAWSATIELMTMPGHALSVRKGEKLHDSFTGVTTADISPFLVVRLRTDSGLEDGCVLVADLTGAPKDRLDVILARQIDTPEKFLRFLYLLLSLGDPYLLALLARSGGGAPGFAGPFGGGLGVLEMLLRALADKPGVLSDLDRLVRRLRATEQGQKVLPDGFEELWSMVQDAARQLKGGKR